MAFTLIDLVNNKEYSYQSGQITLDTVYLDDQKLGRVILKKTSYGLIGYKEDEELKINFVLRNHELGRQTIELKKYNSKKSSYNLIVDELNFNKEKVKLSYHLVDDSYNELSKIKLLIKRS